MAWKRFVLFTAAIVASGVVGCTVKQANVPPLTGPSQLALSIGVAARPDLLTQDGSSQSAIVVTAVGADGRAASGIALRLSIVVDNVAQDFGTLQARTVVTGTDGRASTIYTAPPPPAPLVGGSGKTISVLATVIGDDATTSPPHGTPSVDIRLVPPGIILPPADTPTAQFAFSPATPTANSQVAFDATSSCAGPATPTGNCSPTTAHIVTTLWDFGDGQTGAGPTVSHAFRSPGTFNVTLTVTNDRGLSASATKQVTVGAGTPPTANFVFSPTNPAVLQVVSFNASLSTAAPGHAIVGYSWDFGDGTVKSGKIVSHDFGMAGTYNVVLVVTDDAGLTGVSTQAVQVGKASSGPTRR